MLMVVAREFRDQQVGAIIRDHTGAMIRAFVDYYGHCSNNMAEAKAMLKGENICWRLDLLML